jgi:hypothetical protein
MDVYQTSAFINNLLSDDPSNENMDYKTILTVMIKITQSCPKAFREISIKMLEEMLEKMKKGE